MSHTRRPVPGDVLAGRALKSTTLLLSLLYSHPGTPRILLCKGRHISEVLTFSTDDYKTGAKHYQYLYRLPYIGAGVAPETPSLTLVF